MTPSISAIPSYLPSYSSTLHNIDGRETHQTDFDENSVHSASNESHPSEKELKKAERQNAQLQQMKLNSEKNDFCNKNGPISFIKDSGGNNDVINFTSPSISKENIWLEKQGDDLKLFIGKMNSSDSVTIKDQYKPENKIETIRAGDYELTGDNIDLLTEVMATVSVEKGSSIPFNNEKIKKAINECWLPSHS